MTRWPCSCPRGIKVLGDGTPAHRLAQLVAYPAYFILLFGTLWSAAKMRGRPELRDRFVGTLLIAIGATVVAAGAAFAATGMLAGFIAHAGRGDLRDVLGVPASVEAGGGARAP